MKIKRITAFLLAAAVALCSAMPVFAGETESGITYIDSAEDLERLAEDCRLDSYSVGKQFVLTADLDLSEREFVSIPTFGGTFDGGNHTISGLHLTADGSGLGLFRYIQTTGVVKNLNVSAIYAPNGSRTQIGGIAGNNSGRIVNCSFSGSINAESEVGGIAGRNNPGGLISNCTSSALMQGVSYTGGICGYNEGTIVNCSNEGGVNIYEKEVKLDIADIDFSSLTASPENEENVVTGQSDTGGICGFSSGIIQSCKNTGTVGYQHVGYNVGGIAGRQCGYINGCENYGEIYGRKDCGGIVGQAEPYRSIEFSEDILGKLDEENQKAKEALNKLMDDAQGANANITDETAALISGLDNTLDYADIITGKTEDIFNGYTDGINEISARAADVIDRLAPVTDDLSAAMDKFSLFCDQLEEVLDLMAESGEYTNEALDSAEKAMDKIEKAFPYIESALSDISVSLKTLSASMGDTVKVKAELSNIISSLKTIAENGKTISTSLAEIKGAMDTVEDWVNSSEEWKNLNGGLGELSDSITEMSAAITKINNAIQRIIDSTDADELEKGIDDLNDGIRALAVASEHFSKAMEAANKQPSDLDLMYDELALAAEELEVAAEKLNSAAEHFADAVNADGSADGALEEISEALDEMNKAVDKAAKALKKITDSLDTISNSTVPKEQYDRISAACDNLNKALSSISEEAAKISGSLSEINNQINLGGIQNSISALGDAADEISFAVKIINSTSKEFDEAKDSLSAAIDSLSSAASNAGDCAETLGEMGDILSECFNDISDILNDLSDKGAVTFPNIDEEYTSAVDGLQWELDGMTATLSRLNTLIRNENEILIEDLRAVGDSISAMVDIFADLKDNEYSDSESVEEAMSRLSTDLSEEDDNSITTGKTANSRNYGKIEADVNVGGIAGIMGLELGIDPEDEIANSGNLSIRFKYYVRDVVKGCENYGEVISKKNFAGGIVGRQDMGLVADCTEDGRIESKSGSYAGGIAGASYAVLKNNVSTVSISAGSYVGGIAGFGTDMTGNYALADITGGSERIGAVAGDYDTESEKISGNFFVDRGTGAMDGISYSGKAQPTDFAHYAKKRGLSEESARLSLTFTADGEIVKVINFNYGDSVAESEIPEIPPKVGCFGAWEDFDYSLVTFSYVINAVYTDYITSVSTAETDERGFPLVIADGLYDDKAVISVSGDSTVKVNDKTALLRTVTVTGADYSGKNPTKLRFLLPDDGKDYTLMQSVGGAWTEAAAFNNGNYIIIEGVTLENGSGSFCLMPKERGNYILFIAIGGGLAAMVAAVLVIVGVKRKKSHKEKVKVSQ
ncbi:MAG: GLUG motif-containing protein [Ruminiclostridium sp.]